MNRTTTALWTKDFLIVTFVHFLFATNFYLLIVTVSVYAMDRLHASPSSAGLAASIFVVGSPIARLFVGRLMERTGQRKILYAGLVLCLLMTLSYFGTNGILYLIIVRFIHGISFGMMHTAAASIAVRIIPRERTGEGLAYYMLAVPLATAIGPFLGMLILQHGEFRLIFVVCTVCAALALVGALFLATPETVSAEGRGEAAGGIRLKDFFEPKAVPISTVCGIIFLCYSSVLAFLSVYSRQIRLTDAAGLFFIVYSIAVLLSRPSVGRLVDSKGENSVMYPSLLAFIVGMLILSGAHNGFALLAAGALLGIGSGAVLTISQTVAVKVTPPLRVGIATSTFWIFVDVGGGAGPFILGLFIPYTGYRGMYLCVAAVALACAFLYHMVHGRKVERIGGCYAFCRRKL